MVSGDASTPTEPLGPDFRPPTGCKYNAIHQKETRSTNKKPPADSIVVVLLKLDLKGRLVSDNGHTYSTVKQLYHNQLVTYAWSFA